MRDKIKSFVIQLENKNQTKLAAKLKKTLSTVEEFVKTIGVPRNDPKVLKIKEIKSKPQLYGKDKAMIKLLWMQVKRESLHKKMKEYNITRSVVEEKSDFLDQVLDYLDKEVTKAIVDFKGYPQEKEASLSNEEMGKVLGLSYAMTKTFGYSGSEIMQKYCSDNRFISLSKEFFDIWAGMANWEDDDKVPFNLDFLKLNTQKLESQKSILEPQFKRIMEKVNYFRKMISIAESFLDSLKSNNTEVIEDIIATTPPISSSIYFKLKQFIDEKTLEHLRNIKSRPEMTLWLTCKESKCRSLAEKVAQE